MKRILAIMLVLVFSLTLVVGCGGSNGGNNAEDGQIVLRVGHVLAGDHSYQIGLEKFAELVEEKTNGEVKINVFHSSQLGNERDLVEGMQLGTVEMGLISTGPIAGFVPEVMLLDLPYIIEDIEHAEKVLDGEIGEFIDEKFLDAGIRNLAWWEQGFRSIYNNTRPIEKPEDMNNIKIRVMESPLMVDTFNIMGGKSTPMAWGELYTALQQNVIDGCEGAAETIQTGGMGEVTKYGSLTKQFYSAVPLFISEGVFQNLAPEHQTAIQEAALEARDFERQIIREREAEFFAKLEADGVVFNEPDLGPFQEAVKPLYEKYADEVGGMELIEKVQALAK